MACTYHSAQITRVCPCGICSCCRETFRRITSLANPALIPQCLFVLLSFCFVGPVSRVCMCVSSRVLLYLRSVIYLISVAALVLSRAAELWPGEESHPVQEKIAGVRGRREGADLFTRQTQVSENKNEGTAARPRTPPRTQTLGVCCRRLITFTMCSAVFLWGNQLVPPPNPNACLA